VRDLNREIDERDKELAREYRETIKRILASADRPPKEWRDRSRCFVRITDWGVEKITRAAYEADQARQTLAKPRPANKSLADWRMALRRKLNGDTR